MFIIRILFMLCITTSLWAHPGFHIKNKSKDKIWVDVHKAVVSSELKALLVTEVRGVPKGMEY